MTLISYVTGKAGNNGITNRPFQSSPWSLYQKEVKSGTSVKSTRGLQKRKIENQSSTIGKLLT